MSLTYLHKRRPDAKQMRFYTIGITPTLRPPEVADYS